MPIPVATYFPMAQAAQKMKEGLLPEYDLVHIYTEKEDALKELPAVCAGQQPPKAVIFGGRLPDEEFDEMSNAIHSKAPGVRIVRITRDDLVKAGIPVPPPGATGPPQGGPPPGAGPPNHDAITKILKGKLEGI